MAEQSAACPLPSADIHTTVTRTNLLFQYNSGWLFCAEMRWPRFTSRIVGIVVLWLLNFCWPSAPNRQ